VVNDLPGASLEAMVLHVPDMDCEHCVASVEATLASVLGINSTSVDIPSRAVRLRHDARVTEQEIRRILAEVGYPTSP
jgi:copper chaperone CopZ